MATTFLQLCKDTRQEMGIQGAGPVSVTTARGTEKNIVDWVRNAWLEIQRKRDDWLFMQTEFEMRTSAGIARYPLAATNGLDRLSQINTNMVSAYSDVAGKSTEAPIAELDYLQWRQRYDVGDTQAGAVAGFSIAPNNDLVVFPMPDAVYIVRGMGRSKVQTLAENNEIVLLGDEYIDAIKWRAVMLFAGYEEAGSVYQHAEINYDGIMRRMEIELLPDINNYTEPLA